MEREVPYHLGVFYCLFKHVELNERNLFKSDKTHFQIDSNDVQKLEMRGDENIRLADVVGANEGMTMMVLLRCRPLGVMGTPILVFENARCSYSIRVVEDNVSGFKYRTGRKIWMKWRKFAE